MHVAFRSVVTCVNDRLDNKCPVCKPFSLCYCVSGDARFIKQKPCDFVDSLIMRIVSVRGIASVYWRPSMPSVPGGNATGLPA